MVVTGEFVARCVIWRSSAPFWRPIARRHAWGGEPVGFALLGFAQLGFAPLGFPLLGFGAPTAHIPGCVLG
jgi:hypothetical protein